VIKEKIADEMYNLGLGIRNLVVELQNVKQNKSNIQELDNVCLHEQQIKDKYNAQASGLVKFSGNQI
jgi:hypothetical protein